MVAWRVTIRACYAASVLFVAACAGTQILDLNAELIQLQQQKAALERERDAARDAKVDEAVVKLAQVTDQFERVGDAAYAQATQAADAKVKISSYRIAATAYWQRGSDRALIAAQEGTQICDTRSGFDIAPRDCAMLLIIPSFLVNDLWIARLNSNKPGAISPTSPDFVPRGREAIVALVQTYNGLRNASSRIGGTGVSADMVQALDRQQQRIKSSVQRLTAHILVKAKPADRPAAREICAYIRSEAPSITPTNCTA